MGYTRRQYPTVEVAVLTQSLAPLASGHERAVEGDIIAVRPPLTGVGLQEMHRHLWLRLDGWEDAQVGALTDGVEGFEKRRYQILLQRLAHIVPTFDPALARDATVIYQPFLNIDEDTGFYTANTRALDPTGLVYDTQTRRFL